MIKAIIDIITKNKDKFDKDGIIIEEIKQGNLGHCEISCLIDLVNMKYICRIEAFNNQRLYMHIIDINTQSTIYFFDDYIIDITHLPFFILNNIEKMNIKKWMF